MPLQRRWRFLILALLVFLGGALPGCGSAGGGHDLAMAPLRALPVEVQHAPATVRQAYQFAVANPEVWRQVPCYCGCGVVGHTSNYACYVAEAQADGRLSFDPHALGCSICVDITQDTARLLRQGKTLSEIRAYIDTRYGKFGPSNMP